MTNMKKNIIYIGLLSTVMLGAVSCTKETLTPAPTTSLSDITAFATPDRILGQVKSIYANMRSGSFYGGRYIIYNDIRAEEFINELTNVVTGYDVWNGTMNNSSANSVQNFWGQAYFTINLANVFIDGMNKGGTAVVGTATAANYIAEARLVRAVSYYSLLQLYARPYSDGNGSKPGVPLRLTGNTGAGDYNLARSTVAQVYQQVLDDLNFAEANLPLTYGASNAVSNVTRAHRNTAIALKTRVYLSMNKYAEVITEANKIVSAAPPFTAATGVPFALQSDITNVFKTPYTTTESVLSMPFNGTTETPGTQNQLGYYFGFSGTGGNGGNAEYSLNSAGIIGNPAFLATDKRRSFVVNNPANNKKFLMKYSSASPYTDYAPVMRYSEVLLNLAEARVRSTNSVDAQAILLLNAVHGRSDATTVFSAGNLASPQALIDAILLERRIEFLGEGLRGPDLARTSQPIPAKGNVAAIPYAAQNYIWPISSVELQLNKLMTDN